MRKITKTKFVGIRLTEWEYQELMEALKITKQSISSFITIAMLEKTQKILGENK